MTTTTTHARATPVAATAESPRPAAGRIADEERFRASYARHRTAIWRFLGRRLGDDDLAEDLTSEVFVVAWRRRHDAPADELPWLYGVARRVLSNDRRAARVEAERQRALAHQLTVEPSSRPSPLDAPSTSDAVATALAALSERDREVLLLAAWEELTPRELATALGCRPNTARVRLHRARKHFIALLDDHHPTLTEGPHA
ncbi:MAG: sigma-70 family RNA polymerase sigma factor [Baekduia sp.]